MRQHFGMALLAGASALAFSWTVGAQTSANNLELEEVVVTGSRVITNGNDSPTPVTVVTVEDLQATHPSTVFESLLDLPAFAGSRGTTGVPSRSSAGGNNNQISALNLRGLGPVRTLVLYDGHRVPATQQDGLVDANTIPQMLLQRVDIVTGGASAVYGSDAIGGVVNFITDRKFNGLKFDVQGGISELDDAGTYQAGIAGGTDLFGGRGHIEGSFQTNHDDGIPHRTDRPDQFGPRWTIQGAGTEAQPYFLAANATTSTWTWGGKINGPANTNNSNPLVNYQFASNGVLTPFVNGVSGAAAGIPSGSPVQFGGDGAYDQGSSVKSRTALQQVFARFDFDITDDLHFFLTASGTKDHNFNWFGNANIQNITIRRENAFLSPAYQAQLPATFTFSKKYDANAVTGMTSNDFFTRSLYVNTGLEGKLGQYNWETSYTRSDVEMEAFGNYTYNYGHLYAALDSVLVNGQPVCWVSTQPQFASLYPGCVPINVFGPTSESQAAVAYTTQRSNSLSTMPTDDVSGSITGAPFDNWVGPVNMALSGEWRRQGFELTSTNLPVNNAPLDCTGLRNNCTPVSATNVGTPAFNSATAPRPPVSMTVSEAALEADLPVLKDQPWVQSMGLNLAYRYAKYSVKGSPDISAPSETKTFDANTWKAGLNWHINDALTVRATRSQDIRAPNLNELFQPNGVTYTQANRDILTGQNLTGTGAFPAVVTGGNTNLQPEVASTTTVGVVFNLNQEFSLAIDAFDITIEDFISRVAGYDAPIQNACYASGGSSPYCLLQSRPGPITNTSSSNAVTRWSVVPANIAEMKTRGVDVEANYKTTLAGNAFSLRGLVTYQPHVLFMQPGTVTLDYAGAHGTPEASGAAGPRLRLAAFAHYNLTDDIAIDWMTRWRDKMRLLPDPTLFAAANTNARAVAYSNLNLSYRLSGPFSGQSSVYLNVQNVFNQSAPVAASYSTSTQPGLYGGFVAGDDPIGRYYTVGVRVRM